MGFYRIGYFFSGLIVVIGISILYASSAHAIIDHGTLQMVSRYCFEHVDDTAKGKNPIDDLINAGLISTSNFEGKNCGDVLIAKLLERIDPNSIQFNQRHTNQTDMDSQTAYMCIQVDKNSAEKVCKYWNNAELRTWALNALEQEGIKQYLQELITKSLENALNKTAE